VTILLESGQGLGPFGAKGIGEPAMTPTPAAVMNAVSRAAAAPLTQFPITAERVLAAVKNSFRANPFLPVGDVENSSPLSGERAG
jgi:CO/xanthine dehydrogenase Mo-binding subunit